MGLATVQRGVERYGEWCAEGAGDKGVIVYFTPTAVDGQEV
jgi:hypothetical protein